MNCEVCKFYKALELGDVNVGECWRYPPVEGVMTAKGRRPIVQPTKDWCGEFKRIEAVKQELYKIGLYIHSEAVLEDKTMKYYVRQALDNGKHQTVHVGYFETHGEAEAYAKKFRGMTLEEKTKAMAGLS